MRRLEQPLGWLLIAACITAAVLQLAVTTSTLLSSSLIHPLHDQFRLNLRYLTEPFPLSVLLLENGHRPVLPGVARIIELKWLGGWQWIQFFTAWGLAIVCTFVLIRQMYRAWPPLAAAAGSALVITLIWWNAHARMFIHVYEAVHLFYILGGLIASLCIVNAASARGWPAWWHFSWLACIMAVFSFGPGIATFAALFAAALMRAAPVRVLIVIIAATLVTVAVYVFALPGAEGVRAASGGIAAGPAVLHLFARLGAPAHEILRAFSAPAHFALGAACLAGILVATVLLGLVANTLRGGRPAHQITVLGASLLVFGACANALIAINRTTYFLEHPDQLFADRYLFWASVTWLGAAMVMLDKVSRSTTFSHLAAAAAGSLAAMALPASVGLSGWSAEVYRHVERVAIGMEVDAATHSQIAAIADAGIPVAIRAVAEMQRAHLAGYQGVPSHPFALQLPVPPEAVPAISLSSSSKSRQFSGQLPKTLARPLRREWLWLVDGKGVPLGISAPTHSVSGPRNIFRIGVPALDGIEGYWLHQPDQEVWIGVRTGRALRVIAKVRQSATSQASVE